MKKTKSELMIEIEAAAEAGDFVREIELRGQWMVAPEAEQATEPSEQETAEAGFCPKCGYSLAGGKICSVCGWQEKRGGARPGAGRKPDSAKAQTREPLYQEGYNAGYQAGRRASLRSTDPEEYWTAIKEVQDEAGLTPYVEARRAEQAENKRKAAETEARGNAWFKKTYGRELGGR